MTDSSTEVEPTRRTRAPLAVRELFFWPILALLGVTIVVRLARVNLPDAVYELAFSLGWLLLAVLVARKFGLDPSRLFQPPRGKDWTFILVAAPLIVFGIASVFLTLYALSLLMPDLAAEVFAEDDPPTRDPAWVMVLTGVTTSLVAPTAEEVVFRGILLPLWARRWGVRVAVIATSVVFAALHTLEPISAFVFGIAMCVLYMRTRTLLVPIAAHVLHNVASALAELGEDDLGPLTISRDDGLWAAAAFLISLLLVLVVLRRASAAGWWLPEPARPRTE